jgi:hypothetical protein
VGAFVRANKKATLASSILHLTAGVRVSFRVTNAQLRLHTGGWRTETTGIHTWQLRICFCRGAEQQDCAKILTQVGTPLLMDPNWYQGLRHHCTSKVCGCDLGTGAGMTVVFR